MIPSVYGREHIGQLFMVGIPHPVLDPETRSLLEELRPGGIILLRRNYTDPDALSQLCAQLHSLDPQTPPLIALDHEGGRVHRLAPPFTHFPPARLLGQTGSVALAYQTGFAMGCELRRVGVDINFAPVLDVLTQAANAVIGDRAFAADPQQVAQLGCALARGLREAGVIPCGKHFPGHGGTRIDSHEDLPRDERPKDEIERIDLFPFRCAIAEELEMVMTAHVLYPALDPLFPSTLSPTIISGVLRHTLGFRGVVVSDDLEMGAIARYTTITQAALAALKAGVDLLLLCHHAELALAAREACVNALQQGELSPHRLTDAIQRLAALKRHHRTRQTPHPQPPLGAFAHQRLVAEILWRAQHGS